MQLDTNDTKLIEVQGRKHWKERIFRDKQNKINQQWNNTLWYFHSIFMAS